MRTTLTLGLSLSLCFPLAAVAAGPRTFTDHDGDTIRAELTGAKDGEVVLKEKGARKSFALSSFVLDDREFIVETLQRQKQTKLIQELMDFSVREINTLGGTSGNAAGSPSGGQGGPVAGGGAGAGGMNGPTAGTGPGGRNPRASGGTGISPFAPKTGAASSGGRVLTTFGHGSSSAESTKLDADPERPMTMYGLALPTEELLGNPVDRDWTDLLGQTMRGKFERVVSPGIVLLSSSRRGTERVALAVLSRADIEYIAEALKADLDKEIFPNEPYVAPDAQAEAQGVRTFTDRRGVKLAAKYVRTSQRDVVLAVNGTEKTFPLTGLSKEDRASIEAFEKQKREQEQAAARAAQEAAAQASRTNSGGGGFGRGGAFGGGMGGGGAMGGGPPAAGGGNPWSVPAPSTPEYRFTCDRCGKSWTDIVRISQCSNCANSYEFKCDRCGHRWTKQNQMTDTCPQCSGRLDGSGTGGAAANTSSSGMFSSKNRVIGKLIGKVVGLVLALAAGVFGYNKVRS